MKIIGYAAAYPAMELRDFDHWNNTMKMFIDRAGDTWMACRYIFTME